MSYIRTGAPRNTSKGDYGRFVFAQNMASNRQQNNGYYSSNGQNMVQHVHYPNCPNRNGPNQNQGQGGNPMQDYTIEYGEDAVRAALGGHMPDFQAQFQKQYGNGNTGAGGAGGPSLNVNPQAIQMMNNGKSNVAMIPVVLTTEGDGDDNQEASPASDSNNAAGTPTINPAQQTETGCDLSQTAPANSPQSQNAEASPSSEQDQAGGEVTSYKKENLTNAFESVRKARSSGQVKYGRHVRPSYWKPEVPNPCRKKVMGVSSGSGGGGDTTTLDIGNTNAEDMSNMQECSSAGVYQMEGGNGMMMNQNGYYQYMPQQQQPTQPQMLAPNMQQPQMAYQQRARSLPPQKANRPTYSLCGKCRKCKNLSSENPEASVLTFPKYSNGGFQRQSQMMTSSNLGQSAKNFRAVRFSSHHM